MQTNRIKIVKVVSPVMIHYFEAFFTSYFDVVTQENSSEESVLTFLLFIQITSELV